MTRAVLPLVHRRSLDDGVLTPGVLRARYHRVLPSVWAATGATTSPLARARAAWLWSGGQGVLAGWSAAAVLGLRWVPAGAPSEIVVPRRTRARDDVTVWHWTLPPDDVETDEESGLRCTTPARTAFDLGRRLPVVDAVAAVDSLCRLGVVGRSAVAAVAVAERSPGARGVVALRQVLQLCDPGAESPWESRLRVLLVRAGLPAPTTQLTVGGPPGRTAVLDLGWERWRVGAEFDGRHHAEGRQFTRDLERHNLLAAHGWTVLRFGAAAVAGAPHSVVAQVRAALRRAGAPAC